MHTKFTNENGQKKLVINVCLHVLDAVSVKKASRSVRVLAVTW